MHAHKVRKVVSELQANAATILATETLSIKHCICRGDCGLRKGASEVKSLQAQWYNNAHQQLESFSASEQQNHGYTTHSIIVIGRMNPANGTLIEWFLT